VRQRRNHLILVGLILAALVGIALLAVPGSPAHKKTKLGLDLQGGLEVVLQAVPPKGHSITSDDLNRSISIMRNRVDKLGVSEPEIRKQGSDQIVIELPGVKNPKQAFDLIGKTAQLELFDLEADLTGPSINSQGFPVASPNLFGLLAGQQARAGTGQPTAYYLFDPKKRLVAGPTDSRESLIKEYQRIARTTKQPPTSYKVFVTPHGTAVLTCGTTDLYCPGVNETPPTRNYYYLFRHQPNSQTDPIPEMTGGDLKLSGTRQDFDTTTGQPEVLLAFTGQGRKKFRDVTKAEAVRGRTQYARFGASSGLSRDQFDQHFAIVLDGDIKSTPSIDFQQYPSGIDPVNGARITGLKNLQEAKDLALVLQTGALPVTFNQLEQTQVSATLGKDSLKQAKTAALIGLLVVALFLLLFYRFLGLIAVIGLGIYAAFLYGAILLLNVTLTLPGFAGMILTIGVAADANIVVFERIKEEVRAGKSVRAAIAAGYAKGFHTILDANVVTAITALVLFAVATAGVKGFALMLLVGTVISLITAVAATRAMLGLLAGFKWFDNPAFMGAKGQQRGRFLQIDFMGRRYLWFAISGVVIAISIISLGTRGLNLGIDFKGGTQITFKTPQYVSLTNVRDQAAAIGRSDAVIQGRGSSHGDAYKSFQIRTKSLKPGEQETLSGDLQEQLQAQSIGIKNVSSSFGRQIAKLAILAIIVSLLLITIYIAFRFDFKFAVPVIIAMLHDIVITVGVYSLTGSEVSTATVAAVLTVLGYSIYDTIIIFDRIRENIPLMRNTRTSFATIANVSLWETIRRSLATTFITLLPVTALLLFGGDTLKSFAFALLIGITSGAYSSIFVAAPLLTMWKEREPEWRRLVGSTELAGGVGQLVLDEAEQAAAAEPSPDTPLLPEIEPAPAPAVASGGDGAVPKSQAKRERRRQRRRTRPHGRAR
jgi:SecD/SecF fusion protein